MESIILYFFTYVDNNENFKYEYITNIFAKEKTYIFFSSFRPFVFLLSSSFICVVIVSRLTVDLNFFRVSEITIYYRSCTDNENICVNFVFPIFFRSIILLFGCYWLL